MTVTDRLDYSRRLVVDTQKINPNKLRMNPKGHLLAAKRWPFAV